MGTSLEEAEALDEATGGVISEILKTMAYLYPAFMLGAPTEASLSPEDYCRTVDKIVRAAVTAPNLMRKDETFGETENIFSDESSPILLALVLFFALFSTPLV
jgi:hypothetical protein